MKQLLKCLIFFLAASLVLESNAGQLESGGPELPATGTRTLGVGQYIRVNDGNQLSDSQLREAMFESPYSVAALLNEMSYGAFNIQESFIVSMNPDELYPPEGSCHPAGSNMLVDVDEKLEPNPDWLALDHFIGVIHPAGACNFNVGSFGHQSFFGVEDPNDIYNVSLNGGVSFLDGVFLPVARSTAKPYYREGYASDPFGNFVFLTPGDFSSKVFLCALDNQNEVIPDTAPIGNDPAVTRCEIISESDNQRCLKRTEDTLNPDANLCQIATVLEPDFAQVSNSTYAHEFLHGYIPLHANAYRCTAEQPISDLPENCDQTGPHQHDIMGSGGRVAGTHMNAYFKDFLGWMPPTSKLTVNSGGSYTVELFDLAQPAPGSSDKLMVEIPLAENIPARAPDGSSFEFDTLTIEFRGHTGFDIRERKYVNYIEPTETGATRRNLADDYNKFGALIQGLRCSNLPYPWSPCIPYEIDMTPGSIPALGLNLSENYQKVYDPVDGYLQEGHSVQVPRNGITIAVTDTSNAPVSITVVITVVDPNDADTDGDGTNDVLDNCEFIANADQQDFDQDGQGDACDNDKDNDSFLSTNDDDDFNEYLSTDPDGDLVDSSGADHYTSNVCLISPGCTEGEACATVCYVPPQDNCPAIANAQQLDFDNDNEGDACDLDIDGDLMRNTVEVALGTNPSDPSDGDAAELAAIEASSEPTKNVPAMGSVGLLLLWLAMLGLGAVRWGRK